MKITRTDDYILVDDWLSQNQVNKIMIECEILKHSAIELKISRKGQDLTKLKKSSYLQLDNHYLGKREESPLLVAFDKYFWPEEMRYKIIKGGSNIYQVLDHTSFDSSELQFYINDGWYTEHSDFCEGGEVVVLCFMLCKEPKRFTGGEFVLEGKVFEHKNNRLILFPSFAVHGVTKVKMTSKDLCDGRITVQHRSWFTESRKTKDYNES